MLTHRNLVANIEQVKHAILYTDDEVALAALPFFHIYGMQVLMNGLLANGVTVISMPRFDMVEALQAVQDLKITRFFAVPPIILGLAKHPDRRSVRHDIGATDLLRCRAAGSRTRSRGRQSSRL